MNKKWKNSFGLILIVLCIFSLALNDYMAVRGGYIDKALAKVGVKEYEPPTDWTLVSWKSSLEAMDYE